MGSFLLLCIGLLSPYLTSSYRFFFSGRGGPLPPERTPGRAPPLCGSWSAPVTSPGRPPMRESPDQRSQPLPGSLDPRPDPGAASHFRPDSGSRARPLPPHVDKRSAPATQPMRCQDRKPVANEVLGGLGRPANREASHPEVLTGCETERGAGEGLPTWGGGSAGVGCRVARVRLAWRPPSFRCRVRERPMRLPVGRQNPPPQRLGARGRGSPAVAASQGTGPS